ncbi:MAG: DNA-directed RNA polymerase subunit D [Thermoproteota archaeon]
MKFEIKKKSENEVKFKVSGIDVSLANGIRRTILTEVPILAIDEVVFFDNDSPTPDEVLAHTLGMIPLKTPSGKYGLPEECMEGKSSKPCRVILTLDMKAGDTPLLVSSEALVSDDPEVAPVSNKIPITYLPPNGKLRLEAYAMIGRGKEHAKWQPVSTISYKYQPVIKINTYSCSKDCIKCVEACSQGVLTKKDGIIVVNPDECSFCDLCKDVCPKEPPAIEVSHLEDTFIFRLEPTGALPPSEIMSQCLKILKGRLFLFGRVFNEALEKSGR